MAQYIDITYDYIAKQLITNDGEIIDNMKEFIWPSELEGSTRIVIRCGEHKLTFNNRTFRDGYKLGIITHHKGISLFHDGKRVFRYTWAEGDKAPRNLMELFDLFATIPLVKEGFDSHLAKCIAMGQEGIEKDGVVDELKKRIEELERRLQGIPEMQQSTA
jgi:hypothetical protein